MRLLQTKSLFVDAKELYLADSLRKKLLLSLLILAASCQIQLTLSAKHQEATDQSQTQANAINKCSIGASCKQRSRRLELDSGSDKRACYCDSNCILYDDCCSDYPRAANLSARIELGSKRVTENRSRWQCHKFGIFGDVLLKRTCASSWPERDETDTRKQCEQAPQSGAQSGQSDPLGYLLPITDLNSGVTYANQHCLRCNQPLESKPKLIYWSPMIECNYKPDLDDRNALYDLLLSEMGRALKYSNQTQRWSLRVDADISTRGERICDIVAAVPDSIEHMIRHCRSNTIDICPPVVGNETDGHQDRLECQFGHQALVYSQTSEAVYRNLACARCNSERQVFCEPRKSKRLPSGTVSQLQIHQSNSSQQQPGGPRTIYAPAEPISTLADNDELPEDAQRSGHGASFSVLLDLCGPDRVDEHIGAVHQCDQRQDQVYDPFFLTCRDVVCGLNQRYDSQLARCIQQREGESDKQPQVNLTQESNHLAQESAHQTVKAEPVKLAQVEDLEQDLERRKFAHCGKILIPAEHYRLFTSSPTSDQLANKSSPSKVWAFVESYQLTLASSQFELVRSLPAQQVISASTRTSPNEPKTPVSTLGQSSMLEQEQNEFALLICAPFSGDLVAKFKPAMAYVTSALLCVSVASLALYLLLYLLSTMDLRCLSRELLRAANLNSSEPSSRHESLNSAVWSRPRGSKDSVGAISMSAGGAFASGARGQSLSSRGVACLAASLLAAYLLFLVGAHQEEVASINGKSQLCSWLAVATYYFFLVAFSWMLLLAYDIWRTLLMATRELRGPAQHSQSRRFICYALASLVGSFLVVGAALLADHHPGCPSQFKPGFGEHAGACWFSNRRALALFFGLPVALVTSVNVLFFLHSSSMVIGSSARSARRHYSTSSSSSNAARCTKLVLESDTEAAYNMNLNAMTSQSLASLQTVNSQVPICSQQDSGDESPESKNGPHPLAGQATQKAPTKAPPCVGRTKRILTPSPSFSSLKHHSAALEVRLASSNLTSLVGSIAKDYPLYCRLSTITGLTWITGLLASLIDHSDLLWYLFVVLNTLQGLFIFIAFGCKPSKLANLKLVFDYAKWRLFGLAP